ncbi:MAG: NIPSNAP family protein [Chloroflexi bacterium]|nr:NIPSNAP family protein [Chloroflexota bacterium]
MQKWVDFRAYNLNDGSLDKFHRLVIEGSLPLLAQHGVDVVAYGPSADGSSSYFLIRAYDSLEAMRAAEEAFYGSDAWRQGPREAILALIESYTSIVLSLDAAAVDRLRAASSTGNLKGG